MGIIFSANQKETTVGNLLDKPNGMLILSRLQAGRIQDGNSNGPYRLNKDELEKLRNETIYYEFTDDCIYAGFRKPVNEIRAILGLPEQPDLFSLI